MGWILVLLLQISSREPNTVERQLLPGNLRMLCLRDITSAESSLLSGSFLIKFSSLSAIFVGAEREENLITSAILHASLPPWPKKKQIVPAEIFMRYRYTV